MGTRHLCTATIRDVMRKARVPRKFIAVPLSLHDGFEAEATFPSVSLRSRLQQGLLKVQNYACDAALHLLNACRLYSPTLLHAQRRDRRTRASCYPRPASASSTCSSAQHSTDDPSLRTPQYRSPLWLLQLSEAVAAA